MFKKKLEQGGKAESDASGLVYMCMSKPFGHTEAKLFTNTKHRPISGNYWYKYVVCQSRHSPNKTLG